MSRVLLLAVRNERTAPFWKRVQRDLGEAPDGVRRLLQARDTVWMTDAEAREVYAWCRDRPGWISSRKGRLAVSGEEWPIHTIEEVSSGTVGQAD